MSVTEQVHELRADIERLQAHTAATLRSLVQFSLIEAEGQKVVIGREAATDLRRAADGGNLSVLGLPGAGKSGAIYDLANELVAQQASVVLFAVDQIEAASTGALPLWPVLVLGGVVSTGALIAFLARRRLPHRSVIRSQPQSTRFAHLLSDG